MLEILLPFASAILNRMRGSGMPKWLWFATMFTFPLWLGHTYAFCALWLLFLAGYAVLPWQAMFSAFTGQPFGRQDKPYIQWMQWYSIALAKSVSTEATSNKSYWKRAGIIYGAFRSIPMLLATIPLYLYTGSLTAFIGLLFVFMGAIYYLSGVVCAIIRRRRNIEGSIETVGAELAMGFLIGLYLVVI